MACPRCGGLDREPLAPGLWRCTTRLSRSAVAALDAHGSPMFTQQTFTCGTEYPEGPPATQDSPTCHYCTTVYVGTCADCGVRVCGYHSAMTAGQRVCDRCREIRTYSRLVSIGDFLAAARAQGNPGVRTWRVRTAFEDPHVVRSRGLHPHDRIEDHEGHDLREVQGWTLADQDNAMLGTDGRKHQLLGSGASWRSSPQVASTWYRVYDFARRSIEDRTAMVRAIADRDGVDLTALAARGPDQARHDWADQDQARERADADLIARAWSAWDAFVADGSFDRHAQDLFGIRRWEPWFGKTATEVSVTGRAVRIGEIGTEFNFDRPGDRSGGPTQMCLTKDGKWVTLSSRWMQPGVDRFDSQLEVASRILERLKALGWTRT